MSNEEMEYRNENIAQLYAGRDVSVKDIAAFYRLSVARVYEILRKTRATKSTCNDQEQCATLDQ